MAHNHAHGGGHHHIDPEAGDRRVFAAIAVNFLLTAAQIIGGVLSGSLALIADALHNFSDAISLVIAFGARKIARRPANAHMSFGYDRVEVVAALINYTTLVLVGFYLIYEAAIRFASPQPVDGWLVIIIAGIALVVDTITALLTFQMAKDSVNIRAAFLHNLADALGSVGVIFAGTLILLYDWRLIDPIITVMIAVYILWHAFSEIGPVIRILMLSAPSGIEFDGVVAAATEVDGVDDVHHVHLWQMGEHAAAFDAHLVIEAGRWNDADDIKQAVKRVLHDTFEIAHSTLELECAQHACVGAALVGHERPHKAS